MSPLLWFRLGVVAMACLGAVALATGEYRAPIVLAAVPVCLASVYLCDAKRYVVLGTTLANVLGVVAMTITLWEFDRLQQDQQLVALAQLLVALECILFYRPKNRRLYLMLILLSLLQFQVASIVHSTMWFGLLMAVYLGVGAAVLCLLHLITCQQQAGLLPSTFWPPPDSRAAGAPWGRGPLPWAVGTHLVRLGLLTMLTAPVLFFLIPRHGQHPVAWRPVRQLPGVPVTGFSTQVRLGELGRIIQSSQQVMRVRFVEPATARTYQLQDPPLLQGVTLWTYENGNWSARGLGQLRLPLLSPPSQRTAGERVLVQIHLEPVVNSTAVFSPRPVFQAPGNRERIFFDPVRDVVRRRPEDADREFQCRLFTTAFRSGKLRRFIPAQPLDARRRDIFTQLPQGRGQLARLRQLALQVAEQSETENWVQRAQALERYLRDSGRFQYTLSPGDRTPGMDPIEDFLLHRRAGHCEYFASALALMLRACGIPSRMVVGFKPSEFNSVGEYYVVRQQDAHTWVQAYIPREQLPPEVADELPPQVEAVWMILDPTPASEEFEAQASFDWSSLISFLSTFWSQYVVRMDANRQHQFLQEWLVSQRPDGTLRLTPLGTGLVFALFGMILWLARRRLGRLLFGPGKRSSRQGAAKDAEVPFYSRLERVLATRLQRQRNRSQTPGEFVREVEGELRRRFPQNGLADVPRKVVDSYYRVRFGNRSLSADETHRLEELIGRLDRALQNGSRAAEKPPGAT